MGRTDSGELIKAVRRKIGIARYHLDRLREALVEDPPSIEQQAHFEGVLLSIEAARWQANSVVINARRAGTLLRAEDEFDGWTGRTIARDLRDVRNAAAHGWYSKAAGVWKPTGSSYEGSRELVAYCAAAVNHLEELGRIVESLETELGVHVGRVGLLPEAVPASQK